MTPPFTERAVRATMTPPFTEDGNRSSDIHPRGTTGTRPARTRARRTRARRTRFDTRTRLILGGRRGGGGTRRSRRRRRRRRRGEGGGDGGEEETLRARRAEVDDRIRTREAEIRETLREADVTGALASIAASPAAAAAYLAAARVVEKFSQTEGVTRTGAAYVGTLAMGTRDSTRVIRIVAATEKHAFVVGKETRAWEGASWPAVGFERLDRTALLPPPKPPTMDEENADPETSPVKRPPPVRTPPGTSRVVDLEDAREGGAVALRRGGDATAPGARFSPRRLSASATTRLADTSPSIRSGGHPRTERARARTRVSCRRRIRCW